MKRWLKTLLSVVAVVSVTSCSLPIQLEDHARRTNQIVWQVHHEMLLKNILRARDHEPMLFTSVEQVRGSLKHSVGTGTLPIPTGGDATNVYGLNPTATIESNPTFDVSILHDEDFYRGILSPISLPVVQLFIDQGWPKDVVLLMLIESYPGCDELSNCGNTPDEPAHFATFVEFLSGSVDCETSDNDVCLEFKKGESKSIPLSSQALKQFDIVAALKAGYTVQEDNAEYSVAKPAGLVLSGPSVSECGTAGNETMTIFTFDPAPSVQGFDTGQREVWPPVRGPELDLPLDGDDGRRCGNSHLRSLQGVIYFLGESLRCEECAIRLPQTDGPELAVDCSKKNKPADFILSVQHRGEICGIRAGDVRSLRTISFVSQLLGLSKSADSLRTTGAVQIVN